MPMGEFAYVMNSNRFLAAAPLQDQDFAVVGIPFDGAVSNRPGARFGPAEVRRASLMLCDGIHPHFDVSPLALLGDAGDMRLPNASPLAEVRAIVQRESGDLMARHHFDAHCDTWTDHFGEPSGHGTWTYEAIAEGLVEASACVQIGLRSAGERAAREYVRDQGGLIYTARDLRGKDGADLQDVVAQIVQRLGKRPCYLTLDIDCLDPAFAPGTGTPEPGGLSSSQVLTLLEELAVLHTVAMDCVEVAPAYDHAELTSQAASAFIWTYLCGQVAKRNPTAGRSGSKQGA